ncbi:hypothetical protein ROU88_08825 [Macrococcus capreoli]
MKAQKEYDRLEIEKISKKAVVSKLSKDDVRKIKEYGEKYPNEDVPMGIINYFIENKEGVSRDIAFDLFSHSIEQIGLQTQKFGVFVNSINKINGPKGEHSFVLYTHTSGNKAIGQGKKIVGIGSTVGKVLMPLGILLGVSDDIQDGNTLGEAITHNTFTLGSGAIGSVIGTMLVSNPYTLVGSLTVLGVGTIFSVLSDIAYFNNTIEIKTKINKIGREIDEFGVMIMRESIINSIQNSMFFYEKYNKTKILFEDQKNNAINKAIDIKNNITENINDIGQAISKKIINKSKDMVINQLGNIIEDLNDEILPLMPRRKDVPHVW